ncbi:hypothetical protein YC2023_019084 [Brassica napus]
MENQTQRLVALGWRGSHTCLKKKDGLLFHIYNDISDNRSESIDIQLLWSLHCSFVFHGMHYFSMRSGEEVGPLKKIHFCVS